MIKNTIRVLSVGLLLAIAACSSSDAPAPEGGLEPISLRIDWVTSAYHAPFFLGIDKGFYTAAGIDLKVNEGRGSVQVAQLVGTGRDPFGFASSDAVMRGAGAGLPVVSIANLMPVMGQALYVRTNSPIRELSDLKGKSIAVTPGGTNEALLPLLLEGAGLKISDVRQVSADPTAKVRVFLNGEVDAMIATAWALSLFEAGGGARAFVYSDHDVRIVGYNIITSREMIAQDPDLVRRFVDATLQSWDYARTHPEEALDALARHSRSNAEAQRRAGNSQDFRSAMNFVGNAVEGKPYGWQSEEAWTTSQQLLVQHGVLSKTVPVEQMMSNDFVVPSAKRAAQ